MPSEQLLNLFLYSSFEIHLKKLENIKKDLEQKKKNKLVLLDQKQEEIIVRTQKNKKKASLFKEYLKMLEIQRENEHLLVKLQNINTRQPRGHFNQKSVSLEPGQLPIVQDISLQNYPSKANISTIQPSENGQGGSFKKPKNAEKRKREAKIIDEENYKMMVRIINKTPSVQIKKMQKDYQKHLAAKKLLSQFHEDYYSIENLMKKMKQGESRSILPAITETKRNHSKEQNTPEREGTGQSHEYQHELANFIPQLIDQHKNVLSRNAPILPPMLVKEETDNIYKDQTLKSSREQMTKHKSMNTYSKKGGKFVIPLQEYHSQSNNAYQMKSGLQKQELSRDHSQKSYESSKKSQNTRKSSSRIKQRSSRGLGNMYINKGVVNNSIKEDKKQINQGDSFHTQSKEQLLQDLQNDYQTYTPVIQKSDYQNVNLSIKIIEEAQAPEQLSAQLSTAQLLNYQEKKTSSEQNLSPKLSEFQTIPKILNDTINYSNHDNDIIPSIVKNEQSKTKSTFILAEDSDNEEQRSQANNKVQTKNESPREYIIKMQEDQSQEIKDLEIEVPKIEIPQEKDKLILNEKGNIKTETSKAVLDNKDFMYSDQLISSNRESEKALEKITLIDDQSKRGTIQEASGKKALKNQKATDKKSNKSDQQQFNFFKAAFEWLGFFQKSANIVFLGLDNAGKTTLLYMLQSDRFTQTDSTYHPHQAEVTIGNIRFNSYDLGGHLQARKTWREYCGQLDGIIFIIDAADRDRIAEAKKELDTLLEMKELENVPFVVFGNKIDKKESLKEEELREYLGLHFHQTYGKDPKQKNPGARPIEVFMCSVMKRVGYSDGFQWLSAFIK